MCTDSLENIKKLLNKLEQFVLIIDSKNTILYINDNLKAYLKYKDEDILGKNISFITDDELDPNSELRTIINMNGADLNFYINAKFIVGTCNPADDIIFIAGHDITEERLRNLEFEAIVQSSPDLIYIFDKDKNILRSYPNNATSILIEAYGNDETLRSRLSTIFDKIRDDRDYLETIEFALKDNKKIFEAKIKKFNTNKFIMISRDITDARRLKSFETLVNIMNNLVASNERVLKSLKD